jgi:hypothetical protein
MTLFQVPGQTPGKTGASVCEYFFLSSPFLVGLALLDKYAVDFVIFVSTPKTG